MNTKSYLFILITIWFSNNLNAQSFEMPVYFEDSSGNKDSIIIGYNILASYGLDSDFGEVDLLGSEYNDVFEVRVAMYDYSVWPELPRVLESKKMIIGYICYDPTYFDEAKSFMIVIKCKNWPITISWDKELLQEECNDVEIIDCRPGGWFDVCNVGHPYSIFKMPLADSAVYTGADFKIETDTDTLSALFFRAFRDFGVAVEEEPKLEMAFYPNPTTGLIHFEKVIAPGDVISVTDIMGRPIPFNYKEKNLDLSNVSDGLYLVNIKHHSGEIQVMKVIKNSR